MRLSPSEITVKNGEVMLSAGVTFDRPLLNKPQRLWFSFPEKFAPFVTCRSDAFAAGLILLAMYSGEELVIEGELSPRLARGLSEYQRVLKFWYPNLFSIVNIQAHSLSALPAEQAGNETMTLFSGGVDSAFTLMQHLPERQPLPDFQVRYALFIHGYDTPLQNQSSFENASRIFSRELAAAGVELIPVRTNLRYFTSGLLPWMIAHGCITIAAGLVFDRLCGKLLVPSANNLDEHKPWGSSPLVDHWLSTVTTETLHHGICHSRMDKVSAIAGWAPAHHFLRVCINEAGRDGVNNCSACQKCLRTMIALELCGKLEQFKTFHRPIRPRDVVHWTPQYTTSVVYTPPMRAYAARTGQREYLLPMLIAHLRGLFMFYLRRLMPKRLFAFLKQRKFPYERDPFNPAHLANLH
ncbi:MAG TPA: hypothetical protein VLH85_03145 [Levilinea sp.]|nr:hypothetical protein [Levilinea sp.]